MGGLGVLLEFIGLRPRILNQSEVIQVFGQNAGQASFVLMLEHQAMLPFCRSGCQRCVIFMSSAECSVGA